MIAMGYFIKRPEVYTIPNQDASMVAEALVNFCNFRVPQELHSDQGHDFKSCLMQEVLQCLGVNKTRTTPLHHKSVGMEWQYGKTVDEHPRKVITSHQRDWDTRSPSSSLPTGHPLMTQ
jgi:hypothetical protein